MPGTVDADSIYNMRRFYLQWDERVLEYSNRRLEYSSGADSSDKSIISPAAIEYFVDDEIFQSPTGQFKNPFTDLENKDLRQEQFAWLTDKLDRMHAIFAPIIRTLEPVVAEGQDDAPSVTAMLN
jgi:hypothetical protein